MQGCQGDSSHKVQEFNGVFQILSINNVTSSEGFNSTKVTSFFQLKLKYINDYCKYTHG